jgi:hypothetical protein
MASTDPSPGNHARISTFQYDSNAQKCVAIRQFVEPGEPMKRLRN